MIGLTEFLKFIIKIFNLEKKMKYNTSENLQNIIKFENVLVQLKNDGIINPNINNFNNFNLDSFKILLDENSIKINHLLEKIVKTNFSSNINIFTPGHNFPSLSVTGSNCDLNCEHCSKKYIQQMKDISTEDKLKSVFSELLKRNAKGCLISGGCDSNGKVPILKFKHLLINFRKNSNLIFNFHTGLVSEEDIQNLIEIQPNVISFDFTMDDEVIKNIYHLNKTKYDYMKVFETFKKYNLNVVPHITIGLNFGYVKNELEALKYLQKFQHDLIVFIILIPPKNHKFIKTKLEDIKAVLTFARLLYPTVELSLGCMRPRGKENIEIEKVAIDCGINRIVIPSKDILKYIENKGYIIHEFDACCAIPLNLYNFK